MGCMPADRGGTDGCAAPAPRSRTRARRDLLPALMAIRDRRGAVGDQDIVDVARAFGLSRTEVHEVASFFPAVGYRRDGGTPPEALCWRCALSGPAPLRAGTAAPVCDGGCNGPGDVGSASSSEADFVTLEDVRCGRITAGDLIEAATRWPRRLPILGKWPLLMERGGAEVVVANADESDPASSKDRVLMECDPDGVLEGAAIAALALRAQELIFYVRHDYARARERLEQAIHRARNHLGGLSVVVERSGGAYICGEETALVASLEGFRAIPRERPYNLLERGFEGRRTIVHNIESLYRLRALCGRRPDPGNPVSSLLDPAVEAITLVGRVARPGVKFAPWTGTVRDLIVAHGGMQPGFAPGGAVLGGVLGSILVGRELDVPRSALEAAGHFLGAGVVVFSDQDDPDEIARRMVSFLARESCGHCTPCRAGTAHAARLLTEPGANAGELAELAVVMREASVCGLGRGAGRLLGRYLKTRTEASQ